MKVTEITVLENINETTDVLNVKFDDDSTALMFYKYADALKYINEDVYVEFREDIYKGNVTTFINTVTETLKVHTLDSAKNIKLYAETVDNQSNVVFQDMKDGDIKLNAVMYCTAQEFRSSERTNSYWVELTVRDSVFKLLKLRLFDYESRDSNFVNKYIRCDITKSMYGLSTTVIMLEPNQPEVPIEVELAVTYINDIIAEDSNVAEVYNTVDFIGNARKYNDPKGYGMSLVALAFELSLMKTYENLLPGCNWDLLRKALMLSHMYVCNGKSTLTRSLQNIVWVSKLPVTHRQEIIHIYDNNEDDTSTFIERDLFYLIKHNTEELMKVRYWK